MDHHAAMWEHASADLDAEHRAHRLTAAKVSAAEFWPFLALAGDEVEFDHRLHLVAGDLGARVEADLHDAVLASLREDFRAVSAAGNPSPERWRELRHKKDPDDEDAPDDEGDRVWERDHKSGTRRSAAWWDEGGSDHQGASPDELDEQHPGGSLFDHVDTPAPEASGGGLTVNHPSGWSVVTNGSDVHLTKASGLTYFHAGLGRWVEAAADESPGNPHYFENATPEQGPNTDPSGYDTNQPDPPDATLQQYDHASPAAWQDRTPWAEQPMSFSPPESGTGGAGWTTQPRQRTSARRTAEVTAPEGPANGNPGYFDQGSDGFTGDGSTNQAPPITGNPDAGTTPTAPSAEPFDNRVDWYGSMTNTTTKPQHGEGMGETTGQRRLAAYEDVDNPGEIQGQLNRTPRNDVEENLRHLERDHPDHGLTQLLRDHLEVRRLLGTPDRPMANNPLARPPREGQPLSPTGSRRPFAIRHTAPGGGEHPPYKVEKDGDGYHVTNGKGESKSDSPQSKEKAEAQQRALYANTDAGDQKTSSLDLWLAQFIRQGDSMLDAVSGGTNDPTDPDGTLKPGAPGGPGAGGMPDAGMSAPGGGGGMTNVPQDGGGAGGGPGQPGGGAGANVLDPNQFAASRRRTAAEGGGGDTGGGQAAAPPPQMRPGGPGAEAMPPMPPGPTSQPGGGAVPQSSKPRNIPGGGGGGGQGANVPQGAPESGGPPGGSGSAPGVPKSGRWVQGRYVIAEDINRSVPTPENPSGLSDEFNEGAFETLMRQRPRQDAENRRANTPQNPGAREPIPTVSSPSGGPGLPGGADEDEDDRREAKRIASAAAARAMAGAR